ncbi:hypothetical protein RYH80_10985 [Halobaculum sp. MBLA0147]|uniref:hypothetical protein n=1 Tax=Halobaculum sp. MBLA0147 TaxID=3079934 RepID=UPI0035254988
MSFRKTTKDVVSTKIVPFLAARPWALAFLLALTLSVTAGSLVIEDGGQWAVEPGVMDDGKSDDGP